MRNALAPLVTVLFLSGCAHRTYTQQIPSPPVSPASLSTRATALRPTALALPAPAAASAAAPAPAPGYSEAGVASWYGYPYDGHRAADGEIYNMEQMVAAHRTLPFDTWVRVYDLDDNKNVTVRIIDRGPFIDGRIIDLSHAAAQAIALIRPGIANVRIEVIPKPESVPPAVDAVRGDAFHDPQDAESARALGSRICIDTGNLRVTKCLSDWRGHYFRSPSMTFAHYDSVRDSSIHEHFNPQFGGDRAPGASGSRSKPC